MKEIKKTKQQFLQKELAYAEGMYRGMFMTLPVEYKKDRFEIKNVDFYLREKSLLKTIETIEKQIQVYDKNIRAGDITKTLKQYGPIIEGLQLVKGKLQNIVAKMNEPEESEEDAWGM